MQTFLRTMQDPSLQDVYDALWDLIEPGATIAEIARKRALCQLDYVVDAATAGGLRETTLDHTAGMFQQLLIEATEKLAPQSDDPTRRPAPTQIPNFARAAQELLGLRPGHAIDTVASRRALCARWLGGNVASASDTRASATDKSKRKKNRYQKLIWQLTDVVYKTESAFQLEQIRQTLREHRRPSESLLRIDWVERFEHYARVASPVGDFEWLTTLALGALRKEKPERAERFAYESLYAFVRYWDALWRFTTGYGGLWFFPSAAQEVAIATGTAKVIGATPLIHLERARLRAVAVSGDLVVFHSWLQGDGSDLLERWSEWLRTCSCEQVHDDGQEECNVHKALRAARTVRLGIEQQWDEIADWYRVERPPQDIGPEAPEGWLEFPGTSDR